MALTDVKSEQIQSSVALAGSPTTTTQSASDNSTKIATTAYVETAVANLVASAPSALNTLDELAAALNDDANFASTITTSIAAKLPLAGGSLTGNLTVSTSSGTALTLSGDFPRLYFVDTAGSDLDAYIVNNANGLFFGKTNSPSVSNDIMMLDLTNQRVGIGASPSTGKLHVKGSGTSSSANAIFAENSSSAGLFAIRNNGDAFILGSTGIGVSSPAQTLAVLNGFNYNPPGLGNSSGQFFFGKQDGGGAGSYGLLGGTRGTGDSWLQAQRIDGTATAYNILLQPSGGNVGIGTQSPGSTLHVDKANVGSALVTFHQTAGNSSADRGLDVETSSTGTTVQRWFNSGAELMRVSGSGYVGIGENNPVAKLAIKGANDTNFEIQPDLSSGVNRITNYNRVTSAYKKLRIDATEHEFYRSGNPTVTFKSNGDLEIEDGNLIVQNGHGIDFSDTAGPTHTGTGSSELLDDYEEGTFTPYPEAYYGNSVTFSGSFSGWYVKVGAKVTVMYKGDNFSFTSGSGGDLVGFRLPFNPVSGQSEGMGNIITNSWAASGRHLGTLLLSTANALVGQIGSNNNNGSWAWMDFNTVGSSNTSFRAIFTYFVTN